MVFFTVKSGARLGALLGIVCLGLAAVGCGSSSSSTPSASHPAAKPSGTANVACAASLLYLNEKIVAPAFQGATGLKYSGRAGPSTGLQQEIASGEITPGVSSPCWSLPRPSTTCRRTRSPRPRDLGLR